MKTIHFHQLTKKHKKENSIFSEEYPSTCHIYNKNDRTLSTKSIKRT